MASDDFPAAVGPVITGTASGRDLRISFVRQKRSSRDELLYVSGARSASNGPAVRPADFQLIERRAECLRGIHIRRRLTLSTGGDGADHNRLAAERFVLKSKCPQVIPFILQYSLLRFIERDVNRDEQNLTRRIA